MQNLRYNYRIYPSDEQLSLLKQAGGSCRYIWNYFLAKEMAQYEQDNTFNFVSKNSKDLTSLKQNIEWLKIPPSTALQQTLRNLDHSLKQSFKNANSRKGFPTFKKKKFNSTSFNLTMISSNNFINDNIFKIPKIGEVKIKLHRKPPSDFKSCAVKQKAGKWYVSFVVKKECKQKQPISSAIGIDMNSKDLVLLQKVK